MVNKGLHMGTIRFSLPADKIDRFGKGPIDLIYQLHGKRKFFRTSIKLFQANWDQDIQRAVYRDKKAAKQYAKEKELPEVDYSLLLTAKEAGEINSSLNAYAGDIRSIEKRFEMDGVVYSSEMVIEKMNALKAPLTKKEAHSDIVLNYIDKYIRDHSTTRVKGSLSVYKNLKAHLSAMIAEKKINITFENIDHRFLQDFQNFLIERRGLANITVAKQISTLKTFLGYARKEDFKVSDKYKDFKIKKEPLEVTALTSEEFEKLLTLDLSGNKRLDQVRDVFCFACATGLRYSDLDQLRSEHIYVDEIRLTVKKTKELLSVPLNSVSFMILKKYRGMHKPLPVISNQKMNAYLKGWDEKDKSGKIVHNVGLCELAGINTPTEIVRFRGAQREVNVYPKYELIGVHTARKTFVTLSLEKGMSAQEIMKITGHTDYKSFQRYEHVTNDRKKVVMAKAWGAVPKAKLKAV